MIFCFWAEFSGSNQNCSHWLSPSLNRMVSGTNRTMTAAEATSGWWHTPSPSLATTTANKNISSSKANTIEFCSYGHCPNGWVRLGPCQDGLGLIFNEFLPLLWQLFFNQFLYLDLKALFFFFRNSVTSYSRWFQGNKWAGHWPSRGRHQSGDIQSANQNPLSEWDNNSMWQGVAQN